MRLATVLRTAAATGGPARFVRALSPSGYRHLRRQPGAVAERATPPRRIDERASPDRLSRATGSAVPDVYLDVSAGGILLRPFVLL
jgi:hypothetical protein